MFVVNRLKKGGYKGLTNSTIVVTGVHQAISALLSVFPYLQAIIDYSIFLLLSSKSRKAGV